MVDGGPSKPWEGEVFAVLEVLRSARNILEKLLHRGTSGSVAPAEPKLEV